MYDPSSAATLPHWSFRTDQKKTLPKCLGKSRLGSFVRDVPLVIFMPWHILKSLSGREVVHFRLGVLTLHSAPQSPFGGNRCNGLPCITARRFMSEIFTQTTHRRYFGIICYKSDC